MNDRLPYEEQLAQQWNDLPLPDENRAWTDMKRRLEEDDDNGIIPFWLRGCGLWGLLAVVLIGIGWWIVRPEKWWNKKQKTESSTTVQSDQDSSAKTFKTDTTQLTIKGLNERTRPGETDIIKKPGQGNTRDNSTVITTTGQVKGKNSKKENQPIKAKNTGTTIIAGKNNLSGKTRSKEKNKKEAGKDQMDISIQSPPGSKKENGDVVDMKTQPPPTVKDSMSTPANKKDAVGDKTAVDSAVKKTSEPISKTNDPKKDSSKPKSISFSAGLGMHQLIPIDGQKLTPYNSSGRKGSLGDYIPSVFARMYKNDKWFIQLEFRYGAPQYTKEFTYHQVSKLDTVGPINNHIVTTSNKLKKTFYHQLPLSFNYFIKPNWSVGTGLVWNKFVSAIAQQEIHRTNISTQRDSLVSNNIVADKNDSTSSFKKSYFQALFETNYRWKRFSVAIRYSFGLQPYIEFTLPGGPSTKEKNQSFQVVIRYELAKRPKE